MTEIPSTFHDGDLVSAGSGRYAEFLDTSGRIGLRVTNALGHGVLLEEEHIYRLRDILDAIIADRQRRNL